MPYHIGANGSNGCSGYPVVDEGGKVVGCHGTEAEATNHLQALYANVPDATKSDICADCGDPMCKVCDDKEMTNKADGSYSPPAGARAAARRAIKFKEDGKANGAGTAVGWTRARQLANGESLSLSTVKRMYSYFSRHEVDKKGKDWANQANPSNGYIMWLAWGGDAGYSWSRGIVQREMDKTLFTDFGKDYTKSSKIVDIK